MVVSVTASTTQGYVFCSNVHERMYVTLIGASEASPFLVINVTINFLSVCLSVMDRHDICFL